jgi:hypothetical protein
LQAHHGFKAYYHLCHEADALFFWKHSASGDPGNEKSILPSHP